MTQAARNPGLITLLSILAAPVAMAAPTIPPDSTDARAIMKAVESQPDGDKVVSAMTMVITDGSGRERRRSVRSWAIDFPEGTKQLVLFEAPADVRNTGLLTVDYEDGAKDDDQWLYLPSLRKSTRISSGDKSGSFMGSDLSYSDMTKADPDHYDYTMVKQSALVDGEDCWVIEARPKTEKAKDETGYVKTHVWVSKSKLMALQIKAWVREGKKLKYIKLEDMKKIDGVWRPHVIKARTTKGKKVLSTTVMTFTELKLNQPSVKEEDFTLRRLEQGL